MSNILQDRKTYRVEVTIASTPYLCKPGIWSLFANYPNEFEAYEAVQRAQKEGHRYARVIIETTLDLGA